MPSKKNINGANHTDFSPCRYEVDKARHIPTKNFINNAVVVKSVSDSNYKRFRDTAMTRVEIMAEIFPVKRR